MPDYLVREPLSYDHDDYAEGDTVNMPASVAEDLVDLGVLVNTITQSAATKPVATKPETEAALHAAIHSAVQALDKSDSTLWNKDGTVPKVDALSSVLGYTISAAERDACLAAGADE